MAKKPTIKIDEPKVPSSEIKSRENFDQLMKNVAAPAKMWYKSSWFMGSAAAALVTATVLIWSPWAEKTNNTLSAKEEGPGSEVDTVHVAVKKIDPPLKQADVPFSSYTLNAQNPEVITHVTGTKITIPSDAFIDREGNTIQGDVRIEYREMHDVADLVLCGIPMTYEENGAEKTFESAGMMQIYAYKDDKRVFLNPDKPFEVKMRSYYEGDEYNLYEFDTVQGAWEDIGKADILVDNAAEEPTNLEYENTGEDSMIVKAPEEHAEAKKLSGELAEIKKDIQGIEKEKPIKPVKANPQRYNFDIDIKPEEFPELKGFKGMLFEVAPTSKFDANFYDTQWTDIRFDKVSTGKYRVTLWKGKVKKAVEVYPVFNDENYAAAMADFENKMQVYKRDLNNRLAEEEAKRKAYEQTIARLQAEQEARMKELEKQMEIFRKQESTRNKIYRVFQANNFGTYNCDSPKNWPIGNRIIASYSKEDGTPLAFNQVVLVERGRNIYFTLGNQSSSTNKAYFEYNPASDNLIWGITEDGNLAYFDDFTHAEKTGQRKVNFRMKVIPGKDLTSSDIKEILQI